MLEIDLGGIKLLGNFQDFKRLHPNAKISKRLSNDYEIFLPNLETDYNFARHGIMGTGHIDYDIIKDRIIGFTLNFDEGKYADLDTPLSTFKASIIKNFNIPKHGWVLSKDKIEYVYSCNDYKIHIRQDHGLGRGSLGPRVWVFSRFSDAF